MRDVEDQQLVLAKWGIPWGDSSVMLSSERRSVFRRINELYKAAESGQNG
jgi:hypothetical protein